MSSQYTWPVFWKSNFCPSCGYLHSTVYTPDLLDGPIECTCRRHKGCEVAKYPCSAKWGFAAAPEEKERIKSLLILAEDWIETNKKIKKIERLLGR